jgi:VWFA-related protein
MTWVMPGYLCALEWWKRLPKFPSMASLSHRQSSSFPLLLAVLPLVLLGSSNGEDPPTRYHTGASEVRVSFFATDQNGRLLENLSKDDFAVIDSGTVIRDFRSLARSTETALDIVALVDTSESVTSRFRANLQHVAQLVDAESMNRADAMSVVQFAGLEPQIICSRDCRSAEAEQKLRSIRAQGPTPLFDALTYTAQFVSARHASGTRQVVILFSDGNDTISRASAREALEAMLSSGALLYSVDVNASGSGSATGSLLLHQMAEATGGRSFSARDGVSDVLRAILDDLRAAYVVTYSLPTHQPGFHSLRILPKHNLNLRFHCRRGYYYEEDR